MMLPNDGTRDDADDFAAADDCDDDDNDDFEADGIQKS